MGRFKHYDYGQMKMLPVSFEQQILPGTFEYTLNHLIDHEIDLECSRSAATTRLERRPAIRSCSRSSSTPIREGEREPQNRTAMPRNGVHGAQPIRPHTSPRSPISSPAWMLLVCDEAGLIGQEMFAVDGVKLPSNASKQWSGTRADFGKKVVKMERAVRYLVKRHRERDERGEGGALAGRASSRSRR